MEAATAPTGRDDGILPSTSYALTPMAAGGGMEPQTFLRTAPPNSPFGFTTSITSTTT
jgi:hypothetical protein